MTAEPMDTTPSSTTPSQKRRHPKDQDPKSKTHQTPSTLTLRNPPWSYIHLAHLPSPNNNNNDNNNADPTTNLDALTAHIQITSALNQFFGLHGAAVPVDVLNLRGREVWIRVPAGDRSALVAAVGGWVGKGGEGWRVVGWSSWSAGAESGREDGRDLFGV